MDKFLERLCQCGLYNIQENGMIKTTPSFYILPSHFWEQCRRELAMVMKLQLYKFIAMGIVISSQFLELRSSRGLCILAITVHNFYLLPNNSFLLYKAHQIAFKRFSYFLLVLFVPIFLLALFLQ